MVGESKDPYKPWACGGGHDLTITQVDEDGRCGLCGEEVFFNSTKQEIEKVLLEEANAPVVYAIDARGRKIRIVDRECRYCGGIFPSKYAATLFCTSVCEEKQNQENLSKKPKCRVCGKIVEAPDRRWKYCDSPECQTYRRGKQVPPQT